MTWAKACEWLTHLLRKAFITPIKFYQRYISRWTPSVCRFTPTCSQYAIDAVMKYGIFKGGIMAIWRILKCHPLHKGGYDPVK